MGKSWSKGSWELIRDEGITNFMVAGGKDKLVFIDETGQMVRDRVSLGVEAQSVAISEESRLFMTDGSNKIKEQYFSREVEEAVAECTKKRQDKKVKDLEEKLEKE